MSSFERDGSERLNLGPESAEEVDGPESQPGVERPGMWSLLPERLVLNDEDRAEVIAELLREIGDRPEGLASDL